MPSSPLTVTVGRSGHIESSHDVHVAVVDAAGAIVADAGEAQRPTFFRSAAKLMQAAACVQDGAADRFGFDDEALALACASHSAEDRHTEVARAMLRACGCTEAHLACGPHPSLSPSIAKVRLKAEAPLGPVDNNCSGKHAAMLALARHHGWDVVGYERPGHPVQARVLRELVRFVGDDTVIDVGVDNCRVRTFRVSLGAMAMAWARAGTFDDEATRRLREAMWAHPTLVAGAGRSCTTYLAAAPRRLLVKVGAEGVYCAALPERGLGVAVKVASGDGRAAHVALSKTLRQLDERLGGPPLPHDAWATLAEVPVKDTRGDVVGVVRAEGELSFR
jgi:L-asparaginase II